jgi:hypothetical protein
MTEDVTTPGSGSGTIGNWTVNLYEEITGVATLIGECPVLESALIRRCTIPARSTGSRRFRIAAAVRNLTQLRPTSPGPPYVEFAFPGASTYTGKSLPPTMVCIEIDPDTGQCVDYQTIEHFRAVIRASVVFDGDAVLQASTAITPTSTYERPAYIPASLAVTDASWDSGVDTLP